MQIIQSGLASLKKDWTPLQGPALYAVGSMFSFEQIQGFADVWYRIYLLSPYGIYEVVSSETFFTYFTKQKGTLK